MEFEMRKLGFAVVFYRPDIAVYDGSIGDSIGNSVGDTTTDTTTVTPTDTPTDTPTATPTVSDDQINRIISYCSEPRSRSDIQLFIGLKDKKHFIEKYLKPLLETEQLKMTIPDKPNSKNQKYIRG
ncbi:MAG: hypothetical protein FWF04_03760 [Clostridiales bacterium]|nr:hypothetical protein [Clostridiales bacterium]